MNSRSELRLNPLPKISQLGLSTSRRIRPVSRSRKLVTSVTWTPADAALEQLIGGKGATPVIHRDDDLIDLMRLAKLEQSPLRIQHTRFRYD